MNTPTTAPATASQQPSPEEAARFEQSLARHPYRALFPLGWFLAWLGLAPWVLFWMDSGMAYPSQIHSMILVQGVLTTFAAGFLFTMFPRRLTAPAPSTFQLSVVILVPLVHALLVFLQELGWAHLLWCLEAAVLLEFSASRVFGSRGQRTGPAAFLWVPIGFTFAVVGSAIVTGVYLLDDVVSREVSRFGHHLLFQGLFLCLAMGVGAMFLPLTSRKESSLDVSATSAPGRRRLGHLLGAVGLLAGFALTAMGHAQWGGGVAAASVLLVLLFAAGIHRLPQVPGTQRRLIWLSTWCLPIGLALTVALPYRPQIGQHVLYVGGLLLLTMSVALHVGLAHANGQELVHKPVQRVRLFGALVLAALACRIAAEYSVQERFSWIAAAAACALLALLPWGALILPRLLPLLKPQPQDLAEEV